MNYTRDPDLDGEVIEPRIKLVPLDQIAFDTDPRHLVRGLIPLSGLVVVWGAPKSGKSFWVFDLAMHVARGQSYRGRKVQQGPIVYCAFEGQRGIRDRVEAYRRHRLNQGEHVPFYLQPVTLDLVADHQELIDAIHHDLPEQPALIGLDTLNQSLRGSESSDQDMSAYVRAANALRRAFDCAVIIIHHCGHDQTRPRGHTALIGAADAVLSVKRDAADNILVTVESMKDGDAGEAVGSRLHKVDLGEDRDGNEITSCLVEPAEIMPQTSEPWLTPNQKTMLDLLAEAMPDGLLLDEWNDKARAEGIGTRRRATLNDIRRVLKERRLVHEYADRWFVTGR